jgi:hypothetical protein
VVAIKQTIYESYRKYNNFGIYFKATVEGMNLGWFISIVIFIIGSLLAFFIAAKEFELPFRKPKTYGWLLKKGVFSWYYLEGLNLFKYAASEYRKEVINNGYDYEIFIEQFCLKNLPQVNFESDKKSRLGDIVAREMLYDILTNKKTFTKKYFKRGKFTTADFLELRDEYNKGNAKDDAINIDLYSQQLVYTRTREEMLELVKEQIIELYKDKRHLGTRMFGMLYLANIFKAKNDQERIAEWEKFTGIPDNSLDTSHIRNPIDNRFMTKELPGQLESIMKFYKLIGFTEVIEAIKKSTKNQKVSHKIM